MLPVDFPAYRQASTRIFALARALTPLVEPLSLDEAYLDVTATPGEPPEMAARLRDRIHEATGLHASFGVATSKTVAKIASDLRKPRGFVVVGSGGGGWSSSDRSPCAPFPGWGRRPRPPSPASVCERWATWPAIQPRCSSDAWEGPQPSP